MGYLEVVKGLNPGQQIIIEGDRAVLGRHPDCDIVLDVGAVSRQHACITQENGQYYVEDLKSRNGTQLNGINVEGRAALADDDEVKICELLFRFYNGAPGDHTKGAKRPSLENTLAMMVDEESSTIMSKIEVSTTGTGLRVTVNPEVKLKALIEITQNLATSLSLDEVLPKILDSLFKVFVQADRGFIVLRDERGTLVPKAVKYRREGADDTPRISRTIVSQAMDSKEAILSADAASDSRFAMSQSIADFRIRSMMCAPLISSTGDPLGVLQIDTSDQRSRFQQDDLDVLASVACQAAFAVENARLHENALRQKAMERDLALAHKVQEGFLPSSPPDVTGYEFFTYYDPANEVGGDFYDCVRLPDNRLAVLVADVSGKGVPAALLMAKFTGEIRYWLAREADPAKAIMHANADFSETGAADRFITLLVAVVNLDNHEVTLVNAGHMPPYCRRANGTIEILGEEATGVPLGVDDEFEYEDFTFMLGPGDSLTSFTDGFSEAMNAAGDFYGLDPFDGPLLSEPVESVTDLGQRILTDVKRFVGDHQQFDDMCLVCFGRSK